MESVRSRTAIRVALAFGLTIGLLLVTALVVRVGATPARAATEAVLPTQSQPAAIIVTGNATIDVTPDIARVIVNVQSTANTAAAAESQDASASDSVRSRVSSAGIAATDIKTLSVQVWPQYDYRNGQSILTGFMASQTLQFTVHDLRRIGAVIDAAVAGGATSVQGITYDVTDRSAASAQALARAVKDAQTKARAMTDAAGLRLGSVVSMTDIEATPYPFPLVRGAMSSAPGASTQVSPPDVQLTVTVTVGWTIG
jgi:uncharacterized protein